MFLWFGNLTWWQNILLIIGGIILIGLYILVRHALRAKIKYLPPYGNIVGNNYATIIFSRSFRITRIGDNNVNINAGSAKAGSFNIFPGDHLIMFDFEEDGVGKGSNLMVKGKLDSGKTYFMKAKLQESGDNKKTMFTEFVESKGEEDLKNYISFLGGATSTI
jgi:hypothetical protein